MVITYWRKSICFAPIYFGGKFMKPIQAIFCLIVILVAGLLISVICKQTAVAVPAKDMPEIAIVWNTES